MWKNLFLKPLLLFSNKRVNSVQSLSLKDLYKIEELFLKVSKSYPENYLSVIRSKEYIKWRYIKNPHNKYFIFGLHKNKSLEGVIIFNIENYKKYKNLEIKDILFTRESIFNILLSLIMKWSIKNEISIATFWETQCVKQSKKTFLKMVLLKIN